MAALVAIAGMTMSIVGAGQTGLSADEAAHVKRLEQFYADGLYVRGFEENSVAPGAIPPNAYVYGPATARVMHLVNMAAGLEKSGEASWDANAFINRHYVVAAMSVIGLLAAAGLGCLLLGGWRWGIVAAGSLAAVPMWTGHAMFNPKDTPVAVGNTVATFALAAIAASVGRRGWARMALVAAVSVGTVGVTVMLGTRPGMWPAVAAAVIVLVASWAIGRVVDVWAVGSVLAMLLCSYAVLWRLYPKVYRDPVTMLRLSVDQSTAFPHGASSGRGYIFERTAIEWPLLLLGFMLIGTIVAAVVSLRSFRSSPRTAAVFGLVGVQAYALTVAAIVINANVYDGLRQLLFAVPGQAVLATVGVATLWTLARRAVARRVLAGAAILALVLPTLVQARLFPYQYAYGNVAAELGGATIANDNWKVSFREFVPEVPPTIRAVCPNKPPSTGPIRASRYSDCRNGWGALKPFWLAYWYHARSNPDSPVFYTLLRAQRPVPTNCTVVDQVVRHRNIEKVVMSQLLRCTMAGVR